MNQQLQPASERLLHLDVLRGFALFGILLVNFEWFTRPIQAIVFGTDPTLDGIDLAVDWLIRVLAEGKFYPIFSMLFGAGFALMAERARDRQAAFGGVYARRLLLLAAFGLAHMVLVWAGDILLVYALTGFVMVALFRRTPVSRLWKWALPFILLPVVVMWVGAAAIELSRFDERAHADLMADFAQSEQLHRESVARAEAVHAEGRWVDNVVQRLDDMRFTLTHFVFWVPPVLGYFLIGRWLVATDRLTQPERHRMWFRRWRSRGLLLGLPLATGAWLLLADANWMVPDLMTATGLTLAAVAGLLLSLAYLSAVTLGAQRMRFLAPAGRMALSNYLAQSLFWTWMVYGHGVGLWGQLPRSMQLVLALVFFALQVAFSHWWLKRFRFGPAEWLWRSLTYWKPQPMLH
jgi:uncharacterized protein